MLLFVFFYQESKSDFFLDLAFEIADVVFITDLIWGDRDGGDEEGAGVDSSYIFSATDGYTSCEAKEVKEITAMVDIIRDATEFILWERIVFSFFVVVCYHMGNNSSMKPSASELRRLQAGSPLPKKEKDEEEKVEKSSSSSSGKKPAPPPPKKKPAPGAPEVGAARLHRLGLVGEHDDAQEQA